MMQSVNYYDVLGVSSAADAFVIKAAYKALAQRYHPDKFHGNAKDAADAEAKMRQLNEAYQVLSDPAKRREYNASFQQGTQQNQQSSQQKSEQAKQQADWAIALRFYPDLTELETRLGKIDPSLISEFRSSLLASQQYEQRQRVASQLEQNYLEDYFGNEQLIVDFARELLLAGKRDGAKELNRMVKVVGDGVSPDKIIEQLEGEYWPQRKADRDREREKRDSSNISVEYAFRLTGTPESFYVDWIKEGRVKGFCENGTWYIDRDYVEKTLSRRTKNDNKAMTYIFYPLLSLMVVYWLLRMLG